MRKLVATLAVCAAIALGVGGHAAATSTCPDGWTQDSTGQCHLEGQTPPGGVTPAQAAVLVAIQKHGPGDQAIQANWTG